MFYEKYKQEGQKLRTSTSLIFRKMQLKMGLPFDTPWKCYTLETALLSGNVKRELEEGPQEETWRGRVT